MHSEGGSIAQQGSGHSGRVATVLPVQYPKKGKIIVCVVRFSVIMGNELT